MRPADFQWNAAPGGLTLVEGEVHVFCAPLDVPRKRLQELVQPLSDDEWQRAGRFHFERDRLRFLAGRGTLREILSLLLQRQPASFVFSGGKCGKPKLTAPADVHSFHFNLAHSGSIAVFAAATHELGVDLERIRVLDEADQIVSRLFSPREQSSLLAVPAG